MGRDAAYPLDASLLVHRLRVALALRERLYREPFYRLVYGESDGLPGLVLDRYGDVVVAQSGTAGIAGRTSPRVFAGGDRLGASGSYDLRQGPNDRGKPQTRFAPSNEDRRQSTVFPRWRASGVHLGSERPDRDLGRRREGHAPAPTDPPSEGRGESVGAAVVPDGKWIAFDLTAKGAINVDIYVISASGGTPKQVTTSPAIDSIASWSIDEHCLYFGSHRDGQVQVWKVPATGEEPGNARQVTGGADSPAIGPTDGRHVYLTKRASGAPDPQNALWRMPMDKDGGEMMVEVGAWPGRSGPGRRRCAPSTEQPPSGTSWVVRFQGFDRRPATEVARLRLPPFLGGPAISVSRDGRWLLSTQRQEDSDLMLVESFR